MSSKTALLFLALATPGFLVAQNETEKQILGELQKLNQRVDALEKKVDEELPKPIGFDREKLAFGLRFTKGPKGNRVIDVMMNSPADKAGVKPGDLLVAINGTSVTGFDTKQLLHELEKNESCVFTFDRRHQDKLETKISKRRQGDFMNERGGYSSTGQPLALSEVEVGQAAPEVTGRDAAGKPIRLSALKGKVVLINFTASWCGPCAQELPELIKVYNEFHPKGFEILSVFLDDDQLTVEHHIKSHNIPWLYSLDGKGWENATAREWGISGVPTNAIVDKNGIIAVDNVRGERIRPAVDKEL